MLKGKGGEEHAAHLLSADALVTVVRVIRSSEQIAQAVQLALPGQTAIADPFPSHSEPGGFDAARADPSELFCLYKPAFFQYLQVLNHGGQGDIERFRQP